MVNLPVIHYLPEWWNTPAPWLDADAAEHRPGDAPAAAPGPPPPPAAFATCRWMRNLILLMETPPVGELEPILQQSAPRNRIFIVERFFRHGRAHVFCLSVGK